MSELLAELFDTMVGHGPPMTMRFFTPNKKFWSAMEQFKNQLIMEVGCGTGETMEAAQIRHFRWAGCDLRTTIETRIAKGIHPMNALRIPLVPEMVVIACRPDHSGWVEPALVRAREKGCTVIYVSKPKNIDRDLDELDTPSEIHVNVGMEGETMLIFK